jgi:hypothetical protein
MLRSSYTIVPGNYVHDFSHFSIQTLDVASNSKRSIVQRTREMVAGVMRLQLCCRGARFLLVVCAVATPKLIHSQSSSFTATSSPSTKSLTIRSSPIHRRFGYLDGFGKSGIRELDGDDMSPLLSKVRPNATTKHKLAAALTIGVFGTLLSRPLWGERGGYWTAVIITYLLYFIEAMSSSTRRYLSNMLTPFEVMKMLNDIRESRPVLRWDIENYHYRYEHAHHAGKGRRTRESRTKVVTHRASQNYVYNE